MIDKLKLGSLINKDNVELSKTEKVIHNFVIEAPEQIIYNSIQNVSENLGVGEATVVRYFKKLGYSSFAKFKMAVYNIIEDLRVASRIPYVDNIAMNMKQTIENTKSLINTQEINEAVKLIMSAKHLFIAGMGTSNSTAYDMFAKMVRVGVNTSVLSDSHFSYMYTSVMTDETCVLIYSFSGETAEMIKLAKNCKEKGAKIIVVSNYPLSTLFKYADVFLRTAGFENERTGGFFSSKVSQIYVSDVLATACALKDLDKTKKYSELVTNSLV